MGWYRFAPYVRVADRKKKAAHEIAKLKKKGKAVQPVIIEGKNIANTFWGKAWCQHLGSYSDYENRLPRGRSYVRHGSVIDLQIDNGEIKALVQGSSIYKVKINISPVSSSRWGYLIKECSGKIDSLIELLLGKLSKSVMEIMTHPKQGLFPHPNEIKLSCSCPDWAELCKHVAAVLYGVGARFDERPEDLFLLRQANHLELISKAAKTSLPQTGSRDAMLKDSDLSAIFGVNIEESAKETKSKKLRTKNTKTSKSKSQKTKLTTKTKNSSKNLTAKTTKNIEKARNNKKSKISMRRRSSLTLSNRSAKENANPTKNKRNK